MPLRPQTLRLRVLWDGHEQVVGVSEPVGLETPSTHGWQSKPREGGDRQGGQAAGEEEAAR